MKCSYYVIGRDLYSTLTFKLTCKHYEGTIEICSKMGYIKDAYWYLIEYVNHHSQGKREIHKRG